MWLLPARGNGEVQRLCFRIGHALVDGVGAAHLLAALLADQPVPGPYPYRPVKPSSAVVGLAGMVGRALGQAAFVRARSDLAAGGSVAWHAADVPEGRLRDVALGYGVTVNDVFLAALSHALRRWQQEQGGGPVRDVRTAMTMSVRTAGEVLTAGNRIVGVPLLLPASAPGPRQSMAGIVRQTRLLKRCGAGGLLFPILSRLPAGLLARQMRNLDLQWCVTHLNLREPFAVCGAPLLAASAFGTGWPWLTGFATLTRTTGTARFALVHDSRLPGLDSMPQRWVQALDAVGEAMPS